MSYPIYSNYSWHHFKCSDHIFKLPRFGYEYLK